VKWPGHNFVQTATLVLLSLYLCAQISGAFSHLHDLLCQETHSPEQECFVSLLSKQQAEPADSSQVRISLPLLAQKPSVLPSQFAASIILNLNQVRGPPSLLS
jgi:hypothetical protein